MSIRRTHIRWSDNLIFRFGIVFACATLAVALCIFGAQAAHEKGNPAFKVGLIPDESGISNPFHALAYQGLLRAQTNLGVIGQVYTPSGPSDYDAKIQQCITDGNDLGSGRWDRSWK